MPATPKEVEQIRVLGETLHDEHMSEALMRMYGREEELLDTDIGKDPEMREITLYNMAALAGAAARLIVKSAKSAKPEDTR